MRCGPAAGPSRSLRPIVGRLCSRSRRGGYPTLWREFQTLLKLVPQQVVCVDLPDGTKQEFRWVNSLDYEDSEQRRWKLNALQCWETPPGATPKLFAWVTQLPLSRRTVVDVATKA